VGIATVQRWSQDLERDLKKSEELHPGSAAVTVHRLLQGQDSSLDAAVNNGNDNRQYARVM